MLLKQTLLYLPAQVVGPLFQLIAMIVWTHIVDEQTVGVITLITATHELLQIGFLAWWSQYALRFFGRFLEDKNARERFYRTENAVLLGSMLAQSAVVIAILLLAITPTANDALIAAVVAYVASRSLNLYIGERARVQHQIGIYSIQQIVGPAVGFILGVVLIRIFGRGPEWPLLGYALAQFVAVFMALPSIGHGYRLWPLDREIVRHSMRYGVPLIIGGALGWVGLNASRFIVDEMQGVAAAGLFAVGYGLGQRAAAVASMLVTAAAYPIAVRQMEAGGSKAAMRQLADNSALLVAILAPSVVGIFLLRAEIVEVLIAKPFQQVTLAILPLSVLAGAIRNFRAHFGDQVFLLHSRTGLLTVVAAVDAVATVIASIVCTWLWGIVGGAVAAVLAACVAAAASFAIGFACFGLRLPFSHLLRIIPATALMGLLLNELPRATNHFELLAHIFAGAATYAVALSLLYVPTLFKVLRPRPQQSGA